VRRLQGRLLTTAETTEAADAPYQIAPRAPCSRATYRNVMGFHRHRPWGSLRRRGRRALAAVLRKLPRSRRRATCCTSWPKHRQYGVTTFQAEDEIAAVTASIGASFGGALGGHRLERGPASR